MGLDRDEQDANPQAVLPVAVSAQGEPLVLRMLAPITGPAPSSAADAQSASPPQPMVEILALGHGRGRAANRLVGTQVGARVRVVEVKEDVDERGWPGLQVTAEDVVAGLGIDCLLSSPPGLDVVRAEIRVSNDGPSRWCCSR